MKKLFCPFSRKECNANCMLYRRGFRYFEDGRDPEPFEDCGFNIAIDCLEGLVRRMIGNQRATEETRNQVYMLNKLIAGLATIKIEELESKLKELHVNHDIKELPPDSDG